MGTPPTVMIVAGESSGDLHGGGLARELGTQSPGARLIGAGGPKMAEAGVRIMEETTRHAVTGVVEVFDHLSFFRRMYRRLATALKTERPDAVVLIDFPDFNLRFAGEAHRHGIPVIYYISPQVWAWRQGRVKTIASLVRKMLVIFPFEEEFYKKQGVDAAFVGHPLMDVLADHRPADLRRELGIVDGPAIGLLPGSRGGEVKRLLKRMLDAAEIVGREHPDVRFLIAASPDVDDAAFRAAAGRKGVHIVRGRVYDVMASSDLLITASGTATVEAAIIGTPMVVTYVVNPVTLAIVRPLIRVKQFAMVNIIAGREIMPEMYQSKAKPELIAGEVLRMLQGNRLAEMRKELAEVRRKLGAPGAARRAAAETLAVIRRSGNDHSKNSTT